MLKQIMNISDVAMTQKFSIFARPTVTSLREFIVSVYSSGASSLKLTLFVCI